MPTGKGILKTFLLGMLTLLPLQGEGGEYLVHRIPLDGPASSTIRGEEWVVREVVIEKGATLWGFSRSYFGKGHYYPHLLAYNDIANPDRIFQGKTLLVPVAQVRDYEKRSQLQGKSWNVSFADLTLGAVSGEPKKLSAARPASSPTTSVRPSRATGDNTAREQGEFNHARAEFEAGKYEKAAQLFERFARNHPRSKLKAEAFFYAAEAHLKASETP